MRNVGQIFEEICEIHNKYRNDLQSIIAAREKEIILGHNKIDRIAFHVIEEIIELRRTYPHKFWKQSEEKFDKKAMVEEASDVFLMARSMWLEICDVCGITEEEFLENIVKKAKKNYGRLQSGY